MLDTILDEGESTDSLAITKGAKKHLDTMKNWTFFLSIISFISVALLIYSGINLLLMENPYTQYMESSPSLQHLKNPFQMTGIITLVLAIVFLAPAIFLLNFSLKTKKAFNLSSSQELEIAILNHKNYYVFFGFVTIVMIVIYLILLATGGNLKGLLM